MLKITSKLKLSTYMILLVLLLSIVSFVGIFLLKNDSIVSNKLEQEIIFNTIQRDTSNILTKILYKYGKQKDILKEKHKKVFSYLSTEEKPLDVNLDQIHNKINDQDRRYNIYITDDDLVIRNTTFKNDLGFNLSFAKDTFELHKKQNIIGVSAPILEASSNKFFSFSDSYLNKPHDKKIMQVSYTYSGFEDILKQLQSNIAQYKNIKDLKAYLYLENHKFTADFYFKKYKNIKPTLEELQDRIKQGKELSKLNINKPLKKVIKKENKIYNEIYIIQNSPIFNDSQIIYSILFDQTAHENMIKNYNILLYSIIAVFLVVIILIYSIRKKENKLEFQDKFVQQSLHEIKTPLSIISLNNELRNIKLGNDQHSLKIDNAIRSLTNAYEDMTYIANMEQNIKYPILNISIKELLELRIKIFMSSFKASKKDIKLNIKSDYKLDISNVELERLIDNNLSNALKYSHPNTITKVTLEENILTFTTNSPKIQHINKICDKYYRENEIKGGHGLGLNIVKGICKKYKIEMNIESNDNFTTFKYIL